MKATSATEETLTGIEIIVDDAQSRNSNKTIKS